MRLQHPKQIADGLSADDPAQVAAQAVTVGEVSNGCSGGYGMAKPGMPGSGIDRIHVVMHHLQDERGQQRSIAPSRKLWTALQALDGYLANQSEWLVDCTMRQRATLRVGTAIIEGKANFLVNSRMNKQQQMHWPRRDVGLLLQVRCTVYNGKLGSSSSGLPPNLQALPVVMTEAVTGTINAKIVFC